MNSMERQDRVKLDSIGFPGNPLRRWFLDFLFALEDEDCFRNCGENKKPQIFLKKWGLNFAPQSFSFPRAG